MHQKYGAMFTSMNLMLGVGPLILPQPFYEGGLILSTLWMIIVITLSYISANYIVESTAKCRYFQSQIQNKLSIVTEDEQDSQLLAVSTQLTSQNKIYDHVEQYRILYGDKIKLLPAIVISIYLLGTSISKFIMTGNTLSKVFSQIKYLNTFQFWMVLFFFAGAAFSFRSVSQTKVLQSIIIFVRFTTIFLMIGGSIYLIITNANNNNYNNAQFELSAPLFNINHFTQIFSNSVFSLMFHHSLPSIIGTLKNSEDTKFFIQRSFLAAGLIQIILPILAVFAFGDKLVDQGKLRYYSYDFQNDIPFIYYISSFYVFLNIAAISVYVIVIRTSILKIILPKVDPVKINKSTVLTSGILLISMVLIAYFLQDNIQKLLQFIGGLFGSISLFIIPSFQVLKARKIMYPDRLKKHDFRPYIIIIIGFGLMILNLYQTISQIVNTK